MNKVEYIWANRIQKYIVCVGAVGDIQGNLSHEVAHCSSVHWFLGCVHGCVPVIVSSEHEMNLAALNN